MNKRVNSTDRKNKVNLTESLAHHEFYIILQHAYILTLKVKGNRDSGV